MGNIHKLVRKDRKCLARDEVGSRRGDGDGEE